MNNALDILNDDSATNTDFYNAYDKLNIALNSLVLKPSGGNTGGGSSSGSSSSSSSSSSNGSSNSDTAMSGDLNNAVNGTSKEGWNKVGANWTYVKEGKAVTGWVKDTDGKWYFLNESGVMVTGWIQNDGKWYYLNAWGEMLVDTNVDGYKLGIDGVWIK